jgi:transposase
MKQGDSLSEVGRLVGRAASTMMRWPNARRWSGARALKVRFSSGRPTSLMEAQRKPIVKLPLKGTMANGFGTELWTSGCVAVLIRKPCRARFHRSHVARLLHDLDFSWRKPERRVLERNEQKIEQWKRKRWPQVKKPPRGWLPAPSLFMNPGS